MFISSFCLRALLEGLVTGHVIDIEVAAADKWIVDGAFVHVVHWLIDGHWTISAGTLRGIE